MRRLFAMVFGALLGAAAMFMAFKFHVIRIKDDVVFVPKPSAALVDAYLVGTMSPRDESLARTP